MHPEYSIFTKYINNIYHITLRNREDYGNISELLINGILNKQI